MIHKFTPLTIDKKQLSTPEISSNVVLLWHGEKLRRRGAMDFSQSAEELLTKLDTYREQLAQVEEAGEKYHPPKKATFRDGRGRKTMKKP